MKSRYKLYTSKHPRCKGELSIGYNNKLHKVTLDDVAKHLSPNDVQEICFNQFQWVYNIELTEEELHEIISENEKV